MRAAAPLTFTVRRFGAWRAALALLALTGCGVLALWWHALPAPRTGWAAIVAAAGVLFALLPPAAAWRQRPLVLSWDGLHWQVGDTRASRIGRVVVALDFGNWMLLRFVAEPAATFAAWRRISVGATWIALQRRGLEVDWHAIRCTVYSPPPAGPPTGVPAQLTE